MVFPYKVGQVVDLLINNSMTEQSVKITSCSENYRLEGEWVVMGEFTEMDGYIVFNYDESVFSGKIHTDDEMAVFDYIERTFGISV